MNTLFIAIAMYLTACSAVRFVNAFTAFDKGAKKSFFPCVASGLEVLALATLFRFFC